MTGTMTASVTQSTIGKLNWAILPISCIMIGFCYLDRSNIAYMQLQLRSPPPVGLGFSDIVYGQGSGLFFVGYSLFQVPSNLILTRVGAPVWLTMIVVLWGVAAALMAGMRSVSQFLWLRLLLGFAEAGTFPGIWYHMALFYPNTEMTLPLSITKSAVMVAQVLSAPVAAALMDLDGVYGLRGWQWLCLVEGLGTVVAGVGILLFLPAKPSAIPALTAVELGQISKSVAKPASATQLVRGVGTAAMSLDLWKLSFVFWVKSTTAYSMIFWAPLVIHDLLGSLSVAYPNLPILLTGVPYIFAAAATYYIGYSSQVNGERKLHTAVPFTIAGLVLLLAPALQGPRAAIPSFVMLCVGLGLTNGTGPLAAMVLAVLPPEAQAGGVALWNSIANLGGYVGPALMGYLKAQTGSHAAGFVAMGVLLLLGAATMVLFDEAAAVARANSAKASHVSGFGSQINDLTEVDTRGSPDSALEALKLPTLNEAGRVRTTRQPRVL